jgi:hypothetical protein
MFWGKMAETCIFLMFVPTGFLLIIGVASNTKPDRRVIQLSHSNKGGLE